MYHFSQQTKAPLWGRKRGWGRLGGGLIEPKEKHSKFKKRKNRLSKSSPINNQKNRWSKMTT